MATSQWWHSTTLPEILGVSDADEDDLYAAMDWVFERQRVIEKKLAARHLENGGLGLYDLSSSYFEGEKCPLARLGYNRDGKKNKLQINYGLLTNQNRCSRATPAIRKRLGVTLILTPIIANCVSARHCREP